MLTEEQTQFLNNIFLNKWTEENGVVNVNGNVNISYMNLTQIPVLFGQVTGKFESAFNKLNTLEGSPKHVDWFFACEHNLLTNLIGAPEICNSSFYCRYNQLTSLEGCPGIIDDDFFCENNPDLKYLWGIGRVTNNVIYDNRNETNKWIIECSKIDIIFPYFTLEENINWIKQEQKYSCLLGAPNEIRNHFSPRILHLADSGIYNESRILDYKKFKKLC